MENLVSKRSQGIFHRCLQALGLFARIRVVREGGPEGMQLLSSPSRPLRLYVGSPKNFAAMPVGWRKYRKNVRKSEKQDNHS